MAINSHTAVWCTERQKAGILKEKTPAIWEAGKETDIQHSFIHSLQRGIARQTCEIPSFFF
jgi:hypothetical protein